MEGTIYVYMWYFEAHDILYDAIARVVFHYELYPNNISGKKACTIISRANNIQRRIPLYKHSRESNVIST